MEPFKNLFNVEMITLMGFHLKRVWDEFDEQGFVDKATSGLDDLELKERSNQIRVALEVCLPEGFPEAAAIINKSLHPQDIIDLSGTTMDGEGIRGWATMPLTDYAGIHGIQDFDLGMSVQKELTKRGSSEFGVRYFLIENQGRALAIMDEWAEDTNYHVRRLVSEGSRPRLPWAMRLPELIADPAPLFQILDKLKDDPEEYVRRSVANNLNDIAKDHPDVVAGIAKKWLRNASPERAKLVRHACRSLVKAGHQKTLSALGYEKPQVSLVKLDVLTPTVTFGGALEFEIQLQSTSDNPQKLIIDYVIHHRKANGKTSPKVFKWKTVTLKGKAAIAVSRKHAMRPITTRKYYEGVHGIEISVNGEKFGYQEFELKMP